MNREDAEDLWQEAQWDRGCDCHINPPCSFCEDGFRLDLEEYLDLYAEDEE